MDLDPSIYFIVVVPDWRPEEASPTQGFALSICQSSELIRIAALLPTNIFDLTEDGRETLVARRISGISPVKWYGQSPRVIKTYRHLPFLPFTLIMLPDTENVAEYRTWVDSASLPPTLVANRGGDLSFADLNLESLRQHFLNVCDRIPATVSADSIERARAALNSWQPLPARDLGYQVGGHNSVTPNLVALTTAGFENMVYGPFEKIMSGVGPYVEQIVRTSNSVLDERERIGALEMHRMFPPRPDLNLFAPAIYPQFYEARFSPDVRREERKAFETVRQMLKRQTGYVFEARTPAQKAILMPRVDTSGDEGQVTSHPLMLMRARELGLSTEVMSALAASEFSTVVRLPNEINRTQGAVHNFATHYRSDSPTSRKRLTAFRQVQARLAGAFPSPFMALLRRSSSGIRIVSDAHLEWLDMDGLPLAIRKCCTRVPVTPGNLFVDHLATRSILRLVPDDFRKVLVISALKRDDPIRGLFEVAFAGFEPLWRDQLAVEFAEVSHRDEFVAAVANFDGPLIVFDGHGSHPRNEPGQLHFKDEAVDVWSLKDTITEIAPIIVLSACDTHAADRNHATAANGFMHLGARTVLASVFPLDARAAAIFTARLLYRVAGYLGPGVSALGRAMTWSEVIWGMLRMQLLTDFLRQVLRKRLIHQGQYEEIHTDGNAWINSAHPDPFGMVMSRLEALGLAKRELVSTLELSVANSSVISYLQIGRPETILIDQRERIERQLKRLEDEAEVERLAG
jgi:hypothetical protein